MPPPPLLSYSEHSYVSSGLHTSLGSQREYFYRPTPKDNLHEGGGRVEDCIRSCTTEAIMAKQEHNLAKDGTS